MELEVKNNLEDALELLATIKYKSYGFPMFTLFYNTAFKNWDCCFRNPANFSNPEIKAETPLEACNKMIEFLIKIKNETITK